MKLKCLYMCIYAIDISTLPVILCVLGRAICHTPGAVIKNACLITLVIEISMCHQ